MSSSTETIEDLADQASAFQLQGQRDTRKAPLAVLINIALIFAFVGLLLGGLWSTFKYLQSPSGYESRTVVSISRNDPSNDRPANHAELIQGRLIVQRLLNLKGGSLKRLHVFDKIPEDEMADEILENLRVEKLTDDGTVVSLRLITPDELDSPTLLNNLVQVYEQVLKRNHESQTTEKLAPLREVSRNLAELQIARKKDIKQLNQSRLSNQFLHLSEQLAIQMNELARDISEKSDLRHHIESTLNADAEAIDRMIWNLRELGFLQSTNATRKVWEQPGPELKSEETTRSKETDTSRTEEAKLTLKRFKDFLDFELERLPKRMIKLEKVYEQYLSAAQKDASTQREIESIELEISTINAERRLVQRELAMLQTRTGWNFQRIEIAEKGTYAGISLKELAQPPLFGCFGFMILGMAFAVCNRLCCLP